MSNENVSTGVVARQEFGASQLSRAPETAVTAAAAQAQAAVQARYIVALQRPRSWDQVRSRLLAECRRPNFAAEAEYALERKGWDAKKGVEKVTHIIGPTIRFAEAAIRSLQNVLPEVQTVFDDDDRRIVRVTVTDLETNVTYSKDITLAKTVERRKLKKGQKAITERKNSYGDTIYILPATDDEVMQREAALVSKALRTLALRLIPGDLIDEGIELCRKTLAEKTEDPDAARHKMLDLFESIGVAPSDLALYLGHDTKDTTPEEVKSLRNVYKAIRDGSADWEDLLEERLEAREQEKAAKAETAAAGKATGTNGQTATVKRIAELRLQNPPAYKAACERAAIAPTQDWTKVPEDIAATFLADLQKEIAK